MASAHHDEKAPQLLTPADPSPVRIVNPAAPSEFLLIGDHAGNVIPSALGSLGLGPEDLARHIGWDIGIGGLGAMLGEALDATWIRQTYSRLVIDCNRRPDAADAIPAVSDTTSVPGNAGLGQADRAARVAAIHAPYHEAIAAELARRAAAGRSTVLIALHSFTPALRRTGAARPWQIGVLHDAGNAAYARALLAALDAEGDLTVGDNEPYRMDTIDYTVPRHAWPAGLPYAELEIRQDLLADEAGQRAWCDRLARLLPAAMESMGAV